MLTLKVAALLLTFQRHVGEAVKLPQALHLIDLETVAYTLLSGVFGFLLNIVIFLQIKYTRLADYANAFSVD